MVKQALNLEREILSMSRMKEFGMQLARMIYVQRMSDEQIISYFMKKSPSPPDDWLRDQINIVRGKNNPEAKKMWRRYAARS